jgi:YD repeat-containing protein
MHDTAGNDVSYTYDELSNIKTVRSDALTAASGNNTVVYYYDYATGRRAQIDYSNGASVYYAYDPVGNVKTITHRNSSDADLLKLNYTRDLRGYITEIYEQRNSAAELAHWYYDYDAAGRLSDARRDAGDGATTTTATYAYTYDDAGNRLSKSFDDGTVSENTTYTYNGMGQMVSAVEGSNTWVYAYDAYGNRISETLNGQLECEYAWDGSDRLVEAKVYDVGTLEHMIAYGYDDMDGRISRKHTDHTTQNAVSSRSYLMDYSNPTGYSQVSADIDTETCTV